MRRLGERVSYFIAVNAQARASAFPDGSQRHPSMGGVLGELGVVAGAVDDEILMKAREARVRLAHERESQHHDRQRAVLCLNSGRPRLQEGPRSAGRRRVAAASTVVAPFGFLVFVLVILLGLRDMCL